MTNNHLDGMTNNLHAGLTRHIMSEKIPESVRKVLAKWGKKGGRAGSKEDKARAGKLGHAAMVAKLAAKLPTCPPEPNPPQETNHVRD